MRSKTRLRGFSYGDENLFQIVPNRQGLETNDRYPLSRQPRCTPLIVSDPVGMVVTRPVDLNRQSGGHTVEVQDIGTLRTLSAKLETTQLTVP